MKRITLLLIGLIACASAFAQSQFPSPNVRPVTNAQEKITKLFWLATTDTTDYLAVTYPGALAFREADSTIYYSDGSKWAPVGGKVDLSGYALKDSVYLRHYLDSALASKLVPDDTNYIHSQIGAKQDTGTVILNQKSQKQNAFSWYRKSIVDTLTNSSTLKYPFGFVSGGSSFYWTGNRLSLNDNNGNVFAGISSGTMASGAPSFINNVAFGNLSSFYMNGSYNTSVGYSNMYAVNGGNYNTAIGAYALYTIDSSQNSAIGYKSCFACEVANSNFLGAYSTTLHNRDSIAFPNNEIINNSGGIILKGDSIKKLLTNNAISRPETHSFTISFNSPYPKTNDTTEVKALFGKFLVINDSTIQLYNTVFPSSSVGSGGGWIYLANLYQNVNVIGNNAIARESNQVVIGNDSNKSIIFGGTPGIKFSTDKTYSNAQVPTWNASGNNFQPATNLSVDSIFSTSDTMDLALQSNRFRFYRNSSQPSWSGNLLSGWKENYIDPRSWASGIIWGGAVDYANEILGRNELMFIWGGYGNVIDSAIASNIMSEHSYITHPTTHGIILGGSLDTLYSGNYTGIFASQYSAIGNATYTSINNSVIVGGSNSKSLGNYSFLSGRYNFIDSINAYTFISGGTNDTLARASNYSFSLGSNNYNSGVATITIGYNARATAQGAVAMSDFSGTGVTNNLGNSFKAFYTNGYNFTGGSVTATQYKLSDLNAAPSSATDTGTKGEIRITADYIYICTDTNTWVRAALSTW